MKVIIVTPRADTNVKLGPELTRTERRLRGRGTTFVRVSQGKMRHVNYPGRIKFAAAPGGLLIVEIATRREEHEWQLLQSFVGYLDRHLRDHIDSISISYR